MWLARHVTRDLTAFCHGELSPERTRLVEAHLADCARCRTALEEIRFGVALASHIEPAAAPASLWEGVRARLDAPRPAAAQADRSAWPGVRRPAALAAAAALVLVVGAVALMLRLRPAPSGNEADVVVADSSTEQLELVTATDAPKAFESAARDLHRERLAGRLELDEVTASPDRLREWLREHAGFDLSLAVARPPEDAGRFRLLGAKVIRAAGARAALVAYDVDARPVTLVSAPLRDVPDPPQEFHLRKKVAVRIDPERGLKTLTWGADGQAYVLVSDLPRVGTDACGICHTAPERRALIRDAPFRGGV